MRRRDFTIGGAAAFWSLAASAQEPGRTYRLGGLFPSPREAPQNVAMFEGLRRSGFVEGQNLTIDILRIHAQISCSRELSWSSDGSRESSRDFPGALSRVPDIVSLRARRPVRRAPQEARGKVVRNAKLGGNHDA